jgi:hypothetical protein
MLLLVHPSDVLDTHSYQQQTNSSLRQNPLAQKNTRVCRPPRTHNTTHLGAERGADRGRRVGLAGLQLQLDFTGHYGLGMGGVAIGLVLRERQATAFSLVATTP